MYLNLENKWLRQAIEQEWCSSTYRTDRSENQWNKNDVAQFTEQINQKTNPTRKM
jgi:hypothetical protein